MISRAVSFREYSFRKRRCPIQILNENQYRVCHPFIQEEEGNREFCGLDSCGLSEFDKNNMTYEYAIVEAIKDAAESVKI